MTEIVREMLPDCTCKIENRRIILMKAPAVAGGGKPVSLKGAVKDDKGAPVVGATVLLSDGGQTKGITTSFDGKFAFPAEILSTDATLSVSFIGYTSYQAKIGNRTFFDVVLTSSEQSIDEVVVVGYGVQKKANLTAPWPASRRKNSRIVPFRAWAGPCRVPFPTSTSPSRRDNPARELRTTSAATRRPTAAAR